MKKLYTLALLAAVTFGASAERAMYNGEKVAPAKTAMVKDAKALPQQQKARKGIAKSISVDELEALNTWSCYSLLNNDGGYKDYDLTINVLDEATGKIEIVFKHDARYTVYGTYNADEYTITIPNNQYMFDDVDGPIYFYFKEIDETGMLVDGSAEVEEIVGYYMDGAAEFPYEYAWAAGDPEAEILGFYFMTAENYFVYAEDPFENATLCPDGSFNENLIYPSFTGVQNTEYADVEVYSNGEGLYKVVDPFKSLYSTLGFNGASPDMVIDATDPDDVFVDLQATGISGGSDGAYGYASMSWYMDPEENQFITKTVEGNTVTITFPVKSTLLYASGSGQLYYGSQYQSTLTFTDDFETAVKNVEAASEGAAVYYNLQGVRVANPEGIVIRVQDGKATKLFVK